jgi:hypothetical protein
MSKLITSNRKYLQSPQTKHSANADTGSTGHFISLSDTSILLDVRPTTAPVTVFLPDGSKATSTHTALINWPHLPVEARLAHVFPTFAGSLISIGQLCDCGFTASYNKDNVIIRNNDTIILSGVRDQNTKLWMLDMSSCPADIMIEETMPIPKDHLNISQSAANVSPLIKAATSSLAGMSTPAKIVSFYHAALFSPTISTLSEALRRGFIDLPGLTNDTIRANPPNLTATAKGHLDQTRKGMNTTRVLEEYDDSTDKWVTVARTKSNGPTNIITRVVGIPPKSGRIHSDFTGCFPVTAKSGIKYILIMFSEESNYIHAELLQSRSAIDFVAAYKKGIKFWRDHNIYPTFCRMDNESSYLLEEFCHSQTPSIRIEYVPPGNHRANKAERAIRTWKDHFVAGLASTDPAFPLQAWDELVPQAELTLNLLRASAISPHISAWH